MSLRTARRMTGFTLVELQIALLIIALMAAVMSSALRLSSKTWLSVNAQQDRAEHRYLVAQYLRRHLSGARFDWVSTEKNGSAISFFGNQKQINFAATYPAFHNDGELYWWNIKLEPDDHSKQYNLVASYFPYDDGGGGRDDDGIESTDDGLNDPVPDISRLKFDRDGGLFIEDVEPTRIVIAENMSDLEFEYFYRDADGVQEWLGEWPPGAIRPLVIRINLASASATGVSRTRDGTGYRALEPIIVTPRFADQKFHGESFSDAR